MNINITQIQLAKLIDTLVWVQGSDISSLEQVTDGDLHDIREKLKEAFINNVD